MGGGRTILRAILRGLRLILLPVPTDDRQHRAAATTVAIVAGLAVTIAGGLACLAWQTIVGP